jgi:L-cysteine/cystine lyase
MIRAVVSPFMADAEKLAAVRTALPALASGIHLNTGSLGPMPAEVAAAMAELETYERDIGRAHFDYYLGLLDRMAEARAGVAAVIGADLDEIALTHATTDGLNIATWGLDWHPGDRAVTTTQEHAGALGPLYALRDRLGVEIGFADVGDGSDDEWTLAAFDRAIEPGTRLVSVSHVLWSTGAVLPVGRIAELARGRGALVVVDGAQAAGAIPVAVHELGADAYAVPAQKWLLGPEGMGAVWVARDAWDRIRPSFAGHFSLASYDSHGSGAWHPDARRFETAGYHRPSVVGMARAIGWLSMYVGLEYVLRRGPTAARRAADALAAIPGVELLTPRHQMGTLVSFRIGGWPAEAALEELGARVFAIARTIPLVDALRISVGFFNSDDEIDRFVGAVGLLAAHTPETLPPRRTLAILGEG